MSLLSQARSLLCRVQQLLFPVADSTSLGLIEYINMTVDSVIAQEFVSENCTISYTMPTLSKYKDIIYYSFDNITARNPYQYLTDEVAIARF